MVNFKASESSAEFVNFLKRHEKEIKRIKQEYKEVSEAGIQDLLLLLWLLEEDESVIFSKLRYLLNHLIKNRFVEMLSSFKLAPSVIKAIKKTIKKE